MNRGAPGRDFSSPQDVTGRDRLRALARGYCQLVGYAPLAIVIHGAPASVTEGDHLLGISDGPSRRVCADN
jgi:hypothetical protein